MFDKQAGASTNWLRATSIHKRFGAVKVLEDVNFAMSSDDAVGIVGPNGAGKTTLLATLAGSFPPTTGNIFFGDRDVTALNAAARCQGGLVRTHQVPKPFLGMTTFENVFVASSHSTGATRADAYERAIDSLSLCGMLGVANRKAETLGLLDRKRLELARALATSPRIILLDEIGGGLTDAEVQELVVTIGELRRRAIGFIWIEHIVHVLLQVVDRLVCMDSGKIIADGNPADVMRQPDVLRAYIGSLVK